MPKTGCANRWTGAGGRLARQFLQQQCAHPLAGQSHFASGIIAFVQHQPGGVVVWSHQGEPGFRYVIEKSMHGFEWYPCLIITNVTRTALFSDSASSGARSVFYRSRILD